MLSSDWIKRITEFMSIGVVRSMLPCISWWLFGLVAEFLSPTAKVAPVLKIIVIVIREKIKLRLK